LLNGGEQIERFSENYERMERCRLATISAIIAYNELQNIETEILSLSED
jgi:hypothetical protein